jgi:hypothetical protein
MTPCIAPRNTYSLPRFLQEGSVLGRQIGGWKYRVVRLASVVATRAETET